MKNNNTTIKSPLSINHALNFDAITKCLLNEPNLNLVAALLQALRWRITKTKGATSRREIIISYSKYDILNLHKPKFSIIDRIFLKVPVYVKEFSSRFVNALASDYNGRSYLLENDKLIILLINLIKSETSDTVARRNCLGTLQQLSLRKKPQLIMINNDMIKWIMTILNKEKETLSEYSYEYATALFMNLTLRSLGKKKCEESSVEVLKILNDLLEHENLQVRTFVNGTLYSLLSRSKLKEQAKVNYMLAMGMLDILKYLMANADERFKRQIHYIIEQLNSDKNDDDAISDINDDENDVDDVDEDEEIGEDEETEEKIDDPNILTGEQLLTKYFTLNGADALKQTRILAEALEESKSHRDLSLSNNFTRQVGGEGPLNRPLTPSMLNKMVGNDKNPPSELKSRPKIARTPVGQEKSFENTNNQSKLQPNEVKEKSFDNIPEQGQSPIIIPKDNNNLDNSNSRILDEKDLQKDKVLYYILDI